MSIPHRNSDPSHIVADDRTFFVTSSTWGKRQLLQSARAAELFLDVLYHYRAQRHYLLHGFVVMLDHFHLLLTVDANTTVEKAVQLIKGGFAFRAGRELGLRAPIWQKGFSEARVFEISVFQRARDYIHENPVRRGLVAACAEYLYSSAHPGFELDPPPQRLKPAAEYDPAGIAKAMP